MPRAVRQKPVRIPSPTTEASSFQLAGSIARKGRGKRENRFTSASGRCCLRRKIRAAGSWEVVRRGDLRNAQARIRAGRVEQEVDTSASVARVGRYFSHCETVERRLHELLDNCESRSRPPGTEEVRQRIQRRRNRANGFSVGVE